MTTTTHDTPPPTEPDRPDVAPDDGKTVAPLNRPNKVSVEVGVVVRDLDEAFRLSQALGASRNVPYHLHGKPSDILSIVLYGAELGIGPMQSLRGIHVINGTPALGAHLWNAQLRKAGHRVSTTDEPGRCTVTVTRGDTGEQATTTFTLDDAVQARLCTIVDGKAHARSQKNEPLPWETYTSDMLYARALVRAARRVAPEVAFGMASDSEVQPQVNEHGVAVATRVDAPAEPDEVLDAEVVPDTPATSRNDEQVRDEVESIVRQFTQDAVEDAEVVPDPVTAPPVGEQATLDDGAPTDAPDDYVDPWTAAEQEAATEGTPKR